MKKLLCVPLAFLPLVLAGETHEAPAAGNGQQPPPIAPVEAQQPVAPEATLAGAEPAPAVTVTEERKEEPSEEKKEKRPLYFSIAAKADMVVPVSRVNPGFGMHLDARYIFPWLNPWLTVGVDVAWYRLSGKGTQIDSQIGLYDYSWVIDTVPVNIGIALEIDKPLPWIVFIVGAGGSVVWARSRGDLFDGNTFAADVAYGYYANAGLEFRFLPYGGITVEYRHTGYFLDFDYRQLDREVGDIGGAMVLVGYKYTY